MRVLIVLAVGLVVALFAADYALKAELRDVQSGALTLSCVIGDESRTIKPQQVVGLMDGVWLFDNGHARNCDVKKKKR